MRDLYWTEKKKYLSLLKRVVKGGGACTEIEDCANCPFYHPMRIRIGSKEYGHICNYILKNSKGEEQNKLTLLCAKHAIAKFGLESTIQERSPF
jgi:hypothetical protein